MTVGILYQNGLQARGLCGVPPPANCQQLANFTASGCVAYQKKNISVCFNLCNDQWVVGWGFSALFNCQKKVAIFGTGENIDHCEKVLHFDEIAVGSRLCVYILTVKKKCNRANKTEHYNLMDERNPKCGNQGSVSNDFSYAGENSHVGDAAEHVADKDDSSCVKYTCKDKYKLWKAVIIPPLNCSQAVEFLQVNEIKIDSILECETKNGHPVANYEAVRDLLYPHIILS
jgi:hypothetical protein